MANTWKGKVIRMWLRTIMDIHKRNKALLLSVEKMWSSRKKAI